MSAVIVIAQRWTNGIEGGQQFGKQVVEALVAVHDEGNRCQLFSAFYDPAQGQDLRTAFHWWPRGVTGLLPWLPTHAVDILARWTLPEGEIIDIKTYIDKFEALVAQLQKQPSPF